MRDFLIVTKALYRANYGIDLKSKQGKKAILMALVLVVCLLPTFALLFNMFLEGFSLHAVDLMIMEVGFAAICFLTVWTSLFLFPSVFYFSNDLEHLLVLPIKPRTIVASKFVIVYISMLLVACLGMIPMLVAYIMAGHAQILSIILFIPQIVLIALPSTCLISIFWMIVLRLLPFFQNKDRFNMITGGLSVLLAVLIGVVCSQLGYNFENPTILADLLQNKPEGLLAFTQIFFNVPFAARSIINQDFLSFLISIGIILVCIVLFLVCAETLYLASVRDSKASASKKKAKANYRKQSSIWFSYFKVELWRLIRTPAYMANCVLSSLVFPVMFIVIALFTPGIDEIRIALEQINLPSIINLPLVLLITGAGMGFFGGSLNGIASTAFSREGKNLDFVKYVPLSFSGQVFIKQSVGTLFSMLTCILILISVHMVIPYPIWYDLFFVLGSLLTSILVNSIAIFVDGMHPKTDWEDETSAVKNNMNVVLEFLISWAILAVVIAPLFLFGWIAHWEIYSIIVLILLTIFTIWFVLWSPKTIHKHMMH